MKFLALFLFTLSPVVLACEMFSQYSFEENSMRIPVGQKSMQLSDGISKSEFNRVLDKLDHIYGPRFSSEGKVLKFIRKWDDPKVNALAVKVAFYNRVTMYGGLARHSKMTSDGFALVACHEIGHHIGGAPHYARTPVGFYTNEGQADYFANLKCFREYVKDDDNSSLMKKVKVPKVVVSKCNSVFKNNEESAICQRGAMAGFAVSSMFASLERKRTPSFIKQDPEVVEITSNKHPGSQCRLDTYFQSALCDRPLDEKLSNWDTSVGSCHQKNGDEIGLRPTCWYSYEK